MPGLKKILLHTLKIAVTFIACAALYYFFPEKNLPENCTIDKMVVIKSKRQLCVYEKGKLLKIYTISLGKNPVSAKEFEGDNRTPEGVYTIDDKNPNSTCHKNLGISYPDAKDKAHAKKIDKVPGGSIKIHGIVNGQGFYGKFHRFKDWTNGCIAVTDEEMDELYEHTPVGIIIEIKP